MENLLKQPQMPAFRTSWLISAGCSWKITYLKMRKNYKWWETVDANNVSTICKRNNTLIPRQDLSSITEEVYTTCATANTKYKYWLNSGRIYKNYKRK